MMLNLDLSPQITPSHCGPSVLQSLLSFYGYDYTQETITQAAGAQNKIQDFGTTFLDLHRAVISLAPELSFQYKQNASLADIEYLIDIQNTPVAVEWQGMFPDASKNPFPDEGHYSLVTDIDEHLIYLLDPYRSSGQQLLPPSRKLFLQRWRETTEIPVENPNICGVLIDYHLLFYLKPVAGSILTSGNFL